SYVGDPRESDPDCVAEASPAAAGQTAGSGVSASSVQTVPSPLHNTQTLSSAHLVHLPNQLQSHVDISLAIQGQQPLQPVQSLSHLHETYPTSTTTTTIATIGDVYSYPSYYSTNCGASYDASYYGSSPYAEMVTPPPNGQHSDVKPTEEELWHFRQSKESTNSHVSRCCVPYDSSTTLVPAVIRELDVGMGFAPQPSTSHGNSNIVVCNSVPSSGEELIPQASAKVGRSTRIKREPLYSENSGTSNGTEDIARRLRRRERNKVAAAKCRNKKKKQQEQLNKDHYLTRQHNEALQHEVAQLEAKVQELRDQLANHSCCLIVNGATSVPVSVPVSLTSVASVSSNTTSFPSSFSCATNLLNSAIGNEMHHQNEAQMTSSSFAIQGPNQQHIQQPHLTPPDGHVWLTPDNLWGQMMD
ncbi:hypothetical protein BIW11_10627, partial [Tropilaelaps mercedesae]